MAGFDGGEAAVARPANRAAVGGAGAGRFQDVVVGKR
jgi:hypothetical protein